MAGWRTHSGDAVALPRDNIDTDQLIPARFMSTPRAAGYAPYLLHDLRRTTDGRLDPTFPLERHPNATILITGRNFGCGSSREAAVYALVDAGIRAVIAPGFGDIFAGNAVNNGLLPAHVSDQDATQALEAARHHPVKVKVDLDHRAIELNGLQIRFQITDTAQLKLINGWDDIDLTRDHNNDIKIFRAEHRKNAPWAFPKINP